VATGEEGQLHIASCSEMRLFRFSCDYPNPNVDQLVLQISLCGDGPFGKQNVSQTVQNARKWIGQLTTDSEVQGKEGKRPEIPWAEPQILQLDKSVTAYVFVVVLVGHGVTLIPTGVLVDTREQTTLVAQMPAPQKSPPDAGPLLGQLGERPLEVMEALMKGLYQTQ